MGTPGTTFRSWVDSGRSVFGVDAFMAASSFAVFLTVNLPFGSTPQWRKGRNKAQYY
jgi:hypothetical protein